MGFYSTLKRKAAPGGVGGGMISMGFLDAYRSRRSPTKIDLLTSYKNLAYACVQINSLAVASVPCRPYVLTRRGQKSPRFWEHQAVSGDTLERLKSIPGISNKIAGAEVRELLNHPISDLLSRVNPFMNRFDLFEWTTASQEVDGNAYWFVSREGEDGKPVEIWPLEAHRVTVIPDRSNGKVVDHYEYTAGTDRSFYLPEEIIHFKSMGLSDPYLLGYSPLRAAFEQSNVSDKLLAYEEAVLDNRARPDMLISPRDTIGPNEAARLENKIKQKFRGGGSGGVIVGESGLDYKALVFPPSDLAALEIRKVSKEELANAFGIPIALLRTEDVNRANAEAAEYQHAKGAVLPRCRRFEEKINERLCPMYDERIFVAFDNPVREDETAKRELRRVNIQTGVTTINEERAKDNLPPQKWGDEPMVQTGFIPISLAIEQAKASIDSMKASTEQTRNPPKPSPANAGSNARNE